MFKALRRRAAGRLPVRLELEQLRQRDLLSSFVWTGSVSNNFWAPGNWSVDGGGPGTIGPQANDDVTINATNQTIRVPAFTEIKSLAINSGFTGEFDIAGGLQIDNGGSLNIPVSIKTLSGANINLAGGAFVLNGGTLETNGAMSTFYVRIGATLQVNTAAGVDAALKMNLYVDNGGTFLLTNAGRLLLGDSPAVPTILICPNASMYVDVSADNGSAIARWNGSDAYSAIDLYGTLATNSPYAYWIDEPILLDGNFATMTLIDNSTIAFKGYTGNLSTGTRHKSLFINANGTVTINNGATLALIDGIQIDGGGIICYSIDPTQFATWSIYCSVFVQNGGFIDVGGTKPVGDSGYLKFISPDMTDYLWYAGNLQFCAPSGRFNSQTLFTEVTNVNFEIENTWQGTAGLQSMSVVGEYGSLLLIVLQGGGHIENDYGSLWMPSAPGWTPHNWGYAYELQ
jgi:hypothetical protein